MNLKNPTKSDFIVFIFACIRPIYSAFPYTHPLLIMFVFVHSTLYAFCNSFMQLLAASVVQFRRQPGLYHKSVVGIMEDL